MSYWIASVFLLGLAIVTSEKAGFNRSPWMLLAMWSLVVMGMCLVKAMD